MACRHTEVCQHLANSSHAYEGAHHESDHGHDRVLNDRVHADPQTFSLCTVVYGCIAILTE